MSEFVLTQADDGRSLEVGLGDTVFLRFAENQTTGYQWAVQHGGGGILTLEGDTYSLVGGAGVGGGGERTLTFRATTPGTANLELELRSLFPRATPVAARCALTVRVRS